MKCEGPYCRERGSYRQDFQAVLCDTHAGLPTYPKPQSRLAFFAATALGLLWAAWCWAGETVSGRRHDQVTL